MKKMIYVFLCLLLSIGMMTAQTITVTGVVTSSEDGLPVVGASIFVRGTTVGTVTGIDGTFSLNVPQNARILVISYIGMETQELPVRSVMAIVLHPSTVMVDEVVVVGYGTQRKRDVTSSIAKVGGADISNLAAPSFDSQLAGRAAGVQVTTSSGMVGVAPTFNIRGISTISSGSQPLIIVDGVPVNSGQVQQLYGRYNPMADINPNDIESIEILKDGAATAIYGSRAANGVVLITTKKGAAGRAQVVYDGYIGTASALKTHDLLNAAQFVEIANEKLVNYGLSEMAVLEPGVDTNWNDYIYQNAFQQNHAISTSGGTDKGEYYLSLGYSNMDGIIRATNQERFTFSANATQNANKWLKIDLNLQAARTILEGGMNQENSLSSIGFGGVRMLPNVTVFNPDDPTGYNIDAIDRKSLGRGANQITISNGIPNTVWAMDNNLNLSKSTRLIGSGAATITFMDGFTFRTQGGMDLTWLNDFLKWSKESGDGYSYQGILREFNTTFYNWNWQNVLNFDRAFNDIHNLNLTAVQEYTYSEYEWIDAYVQKISDTFFMDHIISNTFDPDLQRISGTKTFNGLASYMLRANYNYDSKYYVGGSVRWDGLSRLPEDNRWGTFYGGSLAWRLSREAFWVDAPIVDWFEDLRLRGSFATIGNSDLGSDFPYMGLYSPKKYGVEVGYAWSNMANPNLKWESTTTYDVGLDGSMFGGRLSFEFAYFQKNTKDLVLEVPTAPTMGIPSNRYYANVGKVKNTGVELSLNATPVVSGDFKWDMNFNISFVSNEVKTLVDGADIIGNYTITREGESLRSIYGYDYYGVNKANGNPVWIKGDGSLVQYNAFVNPTGYYVYDPSNPEDLSQRSTLSASTDRKVLGPSLPKWYGGFGNTLTYKDFDLNIFFRFSGGNKIMNATRQNSLLNQMFANNGTEILSRWQSPENPGDGLTPRLRYGSETPFFNTNFSDSHFVEKGDFLKLASLSVGYTLPQSLVSKLDITRIRLYAQAQNLFVITDYSGLDPETSTRAGTDWDGLAQQRSFTFGANITF